MHAHTRFPIDVDTAHDVVVEHLNEDVTSEGVWDPRLAASACLRSSTPEYRADGAALLAVLADDDADIEAALYDLGSALDADRRRTRVHAMAAFEVTAHVLPRAAADCLGPVVAGLTDVDPLVREAAASTVAWVAHAVREDWNETPDWVRDRFCTSIDPLFEQLTADPADDRFEWEAAFPVEHPTRTFWGPVEAGASRRSQIRCHATFAVALLADQFPERVTARSDLLADLALRGDRPETRGYAIDALARCGAEDVLCSVRDRALATLGDSDRNSSGVETLYHFTLECPSLLSPSTEALGSVLDELDSKREALAVETILHAAVHDSDPEFGMVGWIVRTWLANEAETGPRTTQASADLIAAVATAHPERVLPVLGHVLEIPRSDASNVPEGFSSSESKQWDTERAWDAFLEAARLDREVVWRAIDAEWLDAHLDERTERGGQLRRLYAHVVPSPSASALVKLFESLLVDAPGSRRALLTLTERAPDTVLDAVIETIDGTSAPAPSVLPVLDALTEVDPEALASIVGTLRTWNGSIRPGDDYWTDLVTVLARIMVATDDDRLSELLHLENAAYCERFLETAVAPTAIRAAPNQTVPSLLAHLENGDALLCEHIVRTFDEFPTEYGGWESTIRDAVLAQANAADDRVRQTTVRTLGNWLGHSTNESTDRSGDWLETVRAALFDRLDDDDFPVRAYAIRALAVDYDADVEDAFSERLAQEANPSVRFEIQRVLCRHG